MADSRILASLEPGTSTGDGGSGEQNVQSDWDETNPNSDAFIKNKPTIEAGSGEENVQSDWDETDSNDDSYIKNKPSIPTLVNADWDETDGNDPSYIENKPSIPVLVNADWDETNSNDPSYIENKPTIPNAGEDNVQSDWDVTDTTSDEYIKNKPTDAEIGDAAFSNPPNDLSTAEQEAVRTNIGAGTSDVDSFDDLTGTVADNQIPPTITRDTEVADSVTGASITTDHLTLTRRSGASPLELDLPIGFGMARIGALWRATAANDGNYQDTGIILPSNPGDYQVFVFVTKWGGHDSRMATILGREIKTFPTAVAGTSSVSAQNIATESDGDSVLRAGKTAAGSLLLGNSEGAWESVDYFALYEITNDESKVPDPGELTFTEIGRSNWDFSQTGTWMLHISGPGITIPNDAADEVWGVYADDSQHSDGIFMFKAGDLGAPISNTNVAGVAGGSVNSNTEKRQVVITRHQSSGDRLSLSKNAAGNLLVAVSNNRLDPSPLILYRIGKVLTPEVDPYITEFTLSGDTTPAAGDIGGNTYNYTTAVAHGDNVSAARIVGFAGTSPSGAVTVLATLSGNDLLHSTGSFTIPGTVNLAANGVYTTRLEVYTTGQTVGTDTPTTQQDRRIVAHAPATALYHWGQVQTDSNDSSASDTAARVVFATHDTETGNTLASQYEVQLPNDSNNYQNYLFVKSDQTQPTGFRTGGLDASNSWNAAVDRTINGVDYKAYILKSLFATTYAEDNGRIWQITS